MNVKHLLFGVMAFGAALVLAHTKFSAPVRAKSVSDKPVPQARYQEIDAYIEGQMASLNIPGAALAIVEGDQIVHMRTFGATRPGGEAPTPQTPFFIGSLTKSITALAIMQLVEAGKVDLDAPVQRYLPWFKVADSQASAQMTVRHLLNQTSGLTQVVGMTPLAEFDDSPDAVERQARQLADFKPARSPGASWEYSNVNYNLLGLIVETASGESYADYIRNHIFTPLEMRHSHLSKASAQQDGLAVGHRSWFGYPVAKPDLPIPAGSLPSGQLIASAEDMAHYLITQLNGGRYGATQILSAESIAQMHRPAVRAVAGGVDMGAYGMGWFVEDTGQGQRVWHNGQTPDFFAYMAILPEQRRGLVLLVNANQMLLNFALAEVGTGTADLLAAKQPSAFPWGVIPWLWRSFLLIPVIQIVGVIATLHRVNRWQQEPSRRPSRARLWLLHISLPLSLNLLLVAFALGLLATHLRKMIFLFMPDLSWLITICGGFALVWSFVRTRLMLKDARTDVAARPRSSVKAES